MLILIRFQKVFLTSEFFYLKSLFTLITLLYSDKRFAWRHALLYSSCMENKTMEWRRAAESGGIILGIHAMKYQEKAWCTYKICNEYVNCRVPGVGGGVAFLSAFHVASNQCTPHGIHWTGPSKNLTLALFSKNYFIGNVERTNVTLIFLVCNPYQMLNPSRIQKGESFPSLVPVRSQLFLTCTMVGEISFCSETTSIPSLPSSKLILCASIMALLN